MLFQIIRLIRIKHWIKNVFVFAPLVFSLNFLHIPLVLKNLLAFLAFGLASSFCYVVNDILDRERDRQHPQKKDRPIASGRVSVLVAVLTGIFLIGTAAFISIQISIYLSIVLLIYVCMNILYSVILKHIVIIDVMIIAFGFVLRVIAGAVSIDVVMSNWILLTTLFISLFLGFGKRRYDLDTVKSSNSHRPVLNDYNLKLLDYMIIISLSLTIIAYSLYSVDPDTIKRLNTDKLIYTLPLVLYGVFKYLHIIIKSKEGGDPAEIVLKSKSILFTGLLWVIINILILYFENFY
jgi:4-hydroxybenzoate polyprenyltransferase